jgi:outer membrane receptor protein involved in Fe transport
VGRRDPLILALAAGVSFGTARADNPAEILELPQVGVIGTTPLPGSGIDLRRLPANAQAYTGNELRRQGRVNLPEFLEGSGGGVSLNAVQGNREQPDVNLRGFTASPLLGTPQGLSVFLDGVRVNEPFGDVVNWDLIPTPAIASIQLLPGSQPAFGLNTLGGAVAIYTKSGASAYPQRPGVDASIVAGSYGRRSLVVETGGKRDAWDWYGTALHTQDAGWALHNASRVRQLFGKVGHQDDRTDLDLTFGGADNRLDGTQTVPRSFDDPRQPYTWPDTNVNRLAFMTLKGSIALGEDWLLSGNAYLRRTRLNNLSSNVSDDAAVAGAAPATNDASQVGQLARGLGLQLSGVLRVAGHANQAAVGVSLDDGRIRFTRTSQDATFTPDRGTVPLGPFVSASDVDSRSRYLGAYVSDVFSIDERWTLTLAGRRDRADITTADASGTTPALNGAHRFGRFNPAIGLSFSPRPGFTAYASANQGMRAPTAMELTCADPNAPCKLPNAFVSDPPLKAVVARTVELGARGQFGDEGRWSAAVYRTDSHDDLQFIAAGNGATNAGYFANVGTTRRQGLELAASARPARGLSLAARLDLLDATYRSSFVEHSPANATADPDGNILVQPGDRIPGLPRGLLKLRAEVGPPERCSIGATAVIASDIRARGDENNADPQGRVGGWARLDLDARWRLSPRVELRARVDNALDRRYASFGTLGSNLFTGPGLGFDPANPRNEAFLGYGAPRSIFLELDLHLD